jgi:uncharacterized protein (TIGR02246 family)
MRNAELARRCYEAYVSKDRQVVENLLSADFAFTSPYDDHIDRAEYFERCWPNSERIRAFHFEKIVEDDDNVFVLYECELNSGARFRNTERLVFEGGKIKEVQVYFGDPPAGLSKLAWRDKSAGLAADGEAEIRDLIGRRVAAIRAKNAEAAMADAATDVLSFDIVNPFQHLGRDALKRRTEDWFASFDGPIGYDVADLRIAADGDVAFCHSVTHVNATRRDGGKLDMWWRSTTCFRRIDGAWRVTHEHNSVPFDGASGKASLDLNP